jgi:hypothetical protein
MGEDACRKIVTTLSGVLTLWCHNTVLLYNLLEFINLFIQKLWIKNLRHRELLQHETGQVVPPRDIVWDTTNEARLTVLTVPVSP